MGKLGQRKCHIRIIQFFNEYFDRHHMLRFNQFYFTVSYEHIDLLQGDVLMKSGFGDSFPQLMSLAEYAICHVELKIPIDFAMHITCIFSFYLSFCITSVYECTTPT